MANSEELNRHAESLAIVMLPACLSTSSLSTSKLSDERGAAQDVTGIVHHVMPNLVPIYLYC